MGDFRATVRKRARFVDESKCTGCGACAEKCPTATTDAYNLGHAKAKAIYKYFAQGIPSAYTIDATVCRTFQPGKKCGVCSKVCQAGAIDYSQQDQILTIEAGAIILATGYDLFDPHQVPEYGYGRLPNVITALEFERFLSASGPTHGHVYRPTDLALMHTVPDLEKASQRAVKGLEKYEQQFAMDSASFMARFDSGELTGGDYDKWAAQAKPAMAAVAEYERMKARTDAIESAHRLAFIQCVGSRDKRFNEYCSGFCCMHAIKEAIIAREHDPKAEVFIFGMDIRAVGKGFEEYRNRGGRESDIQYVRSRVAEITEDKEHNPVIWYEDTKAREVKHQTADLVILATACQPSASTRAVAQIAGIRVNDFGFYDTDPGEPLDTSKPGVFVCGCAQSPMDIPESVAQASSAAARAAQVISSNGMLRLAS